MGDKSIILTEKQIAFIKANWETMPNPQIAKRLKISIQSLRPLLYGMGLYRMQLEYWTDEQICFLKKNYKKIGDKELAILFNGLWEKEKRWTWKHIEKKRLYLNLKRTPAQLKKIKERNRNRGAWSNTTTWKTRVAAPDGTVKTWNHSYANGQFKVIKVDGTYYHYAHWLWEQEHGPMPAGHVIGFKDRNNMNVVPENLEIITRAEHARRNAGNRKYPDELKSLISTLNQINKIINQKQKN